MTRCRLAGTVTKRNPKTVRLQFVTDYKTFETNLDPRWLEWADGR